MRSLSHHPVLSSPWLLWTLWVLGFALFTAVMPRDVSFDVIHYHLHNGWSGLNDRFDRDLAPAELHSFLNPVYNIGVWWLIERLPGPMVSAILGAFQALVLPVLYYLSRRLFQLMEMENAHALALAAAVLGFLCAPMIALIASVRNDWIGALAFCTALLILLRKDGMAPARVALAALLVGLAAGMKLTNFVYAVAFAGFVLMASESWAARLKSALIAAAAGLAGVVLTGGWWMSELYGEFGSPVFPLMNSVFGAPLGPDDVSRDTRFLPDNFIEGVLRPAVASFNLRLIHEDEGRDLRLVLTYAGCLLVAGAAILQARGGRKIPRPVVAFALTMLLLLAVWVYQFSIMRYAMAAFLLGPAMFFITLELTGLSAYARRHARPIAYGAGIVLIGSTVPEYVERAGWERPLEAYVEVERPAEYDFRNAGVLMAGGFPTAFTASAFPEAWISHGAVQEWSEPFLVNYMPLVRDKIASTSGPLYAVIGIQLIPDPDNPERGTEAFDIPAKVIARLRTEYPVTGDSEACRRLPTNMDTVTTLWEICPLRRTGQAVASRQDP